MINLFSITKNSAGKLALQNGLGPQFAWNGSELKLQNLSKLIWSVDLQQYYLRLGRFIFESLLGKCPLLWVWVDHITLVCLCPVLVWFPVSKNPCVFYRKVLFTFEAVWRGAVVVQPKVDHTQSFRFFEYWLKKALLNSILLRSSLSRWPPPQKLSSRFVVYAKLSGQSVDSKQSHF